MVQGSTPLVVLAAHPNPELYGADRVFLETVEGLVEAGHRVVATLPEDGPLLGQLRACGAEVMLWPTPVLRKSALNPKGLVLLAGKSLIDAVRGVSLVRRIRPDVVYVSTVTVPLWLVVAKLVRVPALSHVHEAEKSVSKIAKTALALPLIMSNAIVANSQFSANVLTSTIPRLGRKISVVYNGVPGPEKTVQPRSAAGSPFRILYVGRLSNRKGVDTVISAMGILKERGVDAHLNIVGAVYPGYEWYETQLRELASTLGINDSVTFHGFCPDIWPHMEQTDVSVVPSRIDEPFGNTAVESILAARPLVVSDSSGLQEAAGGYQSPQFVAVDSPTDIADAIERIQSGWQQFRADAIADSLTASQRHSPKAYQQRMMAALMQIART